MENDGDLSGLDPEIRYPLKRETRKAAGPLTVFIQATFLLRNGDAKTWSRIMRKIL